MPQKGEVTHDGWTVALNPFPVEKIEELSHQKWPNVILNLPQVGKPLEKRSSKKSTSGILNPPQAEMSHKKWPKVTLIAFHTEKPLIEMSQRRWLNVVLAAHYVP